MSQSLAQRLQQSVRTLELIEKVIRGPATGPLSEVVVEPATKVRTLARRVAEMSFGLENAADTDYAILAPTSGETFVLRGLSFVGPMSAQVVGPNIRIEIDLSTLATDTDVEELTQQLNSQAAQSAAAIAALGAEKASVAFVRAAISDLVNASPGALDTLSELAAALGNDANFAATTAANLASKAPLASPALTGTPTAPTAVVGNNTTQVATTAFVKTGLDTKAALAHPHPIADVTGLQTALDAKAALSHAHAVVDVTGLQTALDAKAPLASPALTGTPTAPTAVVGNNTTQVATTAFVATAVAGAGGYTVATQAEAEAGADNTKGMTPLRATQHVNALGFNGTRNAWINGAFEHWQRGASAFSCPAGVRTFRADRTYVNPAGAAVTQQRSSVVPVGARSRYSLLLTGAPAVMTVLVGQRIEAADVPAIKRGITFTAKIYNGSGASFTPNLLIGTPAAVDDFTTVTNRLTQALQACAVGQWSTMNYTVDISAYANVDNGLQVEWQIPATVLDAGGKTIGIAEVSVGLNSSFAPIPAALDFAQCQRFYLEQTICSDWGNGSSNAMAFVSFPVRMRASPTQTHNFTIAPSSAAAFADAVNYQWVGTVSAATGVSGLAKFTAEL